MSTKEEPNLSLKGLRTSECGWSNSDGGGIAFQNIPHVRGGVAP